MEGRGHGHYCSAFDGVCIAFQSQGWIPSVACGVFTLPDTDTDTVTDTDTDKMGLQPICIGVGVCIGVSVGVGQCEHLHTILYNPFFVGVGNGVGVGQCEHTIRVH